MPTDVKVELIHKIAAAGIKNIESARCKSSFIIWFLVLIKLLLLTVKDIYLQLQFCES